MPSDDYSFKAEYAKSNRASCKKCKDNIGKDTLRLAVMVQSPFFDGKQPSWFHFHCFWTRGKPNDVTEIGGFDSLRWEDQERITAQITGSVSSSSGKSSSKSSKGAKSQPATIPDEHSNFTAEYAKSGQSKCRGCESNIPKGEARLAVKDYESQRAKLYGPQNLWYHVNCFALKRDEVGFSKDMNPNKMVGWKDMSKDDQDEIISELGAGSKTKKRVAAAMDEVDSKKAKVDEEENKLLKVQSADIWKYRDLLQSQVSNQAMKGLLQFNSQAVVGSESQLLDRVSDCMVFGSLLSCPECKGGQLVFRSDGYYCTGNVSEWTKCEFSTRTPNRTAFKIPSEYKDVDFLKNYKYKPRQRIFPKATINAKSSAYLNGLLIYVSSSLNKTQLKPTILHLGGNLATRMDSAVKIVLGTQQEVDKKGKAAIKDAEKLGIPVVSPDVLAALRESDSPEAAAKIVSEHTLSKWDAADVTDHVRKSAGASRKLPLKSLAVRAAEKRNEAAYLRDTGIQKLTVKGGAAVDPDSELENTCAILQDRDKPLNAVLSLVDSSSGTNSYYKLQCLYDEKKKTVFYVFRSWGRIGTTIGGTKLDKFGSASAAKHLFFELFLEKTGNDFSSKEYIKRPNKFFPLDIDYGADDEEKIQALSADSGKTSKLPRSLQNLIRMIFDIEGMKRAMIEFELDMKKMPLGKISQKNIKQAYTILTKCQALMDGSKSVSEVRDCSNRFYHIIPHDFGMKKPPLLDTTEVIKAKIDMLDSLSEIECAYNLLKTAGDDKQDPIDHRYLSLKCKMEPIEKERDEFKLIERYLENTHAATHSYYQLELEDLFTVRRAGEKARYAPFRDLDNRKLLWHGSRITNFAGILSQGLRIAPPEAPVTGYMFGKGLYFADMVTKSANYCYANSTNPYGILLLCEVALGNMHELGRACYIESLPKGKHSVKGCGKTEPDPEDFHKTEDDVKIPYGKAATVKKLPRGGSSLLYNEYIVYDVAQLNIKYLLKCKFNYK